jgi:hypothetical protein
MYQGQNLNDRTFRTFSESERDNDNSSLNRQIEDYEKKFVNYLVGMHNALRKDKVSIDEIRSLAEFLQQMKREQTDEYFEALVRPEYSKGCKIPSTIPVPSSSFTLHGQTTIAPNASGNAFMVFNPFFLNSSSTNPPTNVTSSLYLNNNVGVTGSSAAPAGTTFPISIGQAIPPVYTEYRLVSASIVVKYIGRLDIVQGVIGGAIIFDQNANSNVFATANTTLDRYGDFNQAMDSYYFQENLTLNGIRLLYFPLDTTFEQYIPVGIGNANNPKPGFAFLIYIQDGVPSVANYKVDIFCNFEALPDAAFLNYIPQSVCPPVDSKSKEEAVKKVQLEPITGSEIVRPSGKGSESSFWDKMKSGLGAILPSVGTLASLIPGVGKILGPLVTAGSQLMNSSIPNNAEKSYGNRFIPADLNTSVWSTNGNY